MKYFFELNEHEGEFVVPYYKLIEYGVITTMKPSRIKTKLNVLKLIENKDYIHIDASKYITQDLNNHNNTSMFTPQTFKKILINVSLSIRKTIFSGRRPKKIYMLTPETFKTFLLKSKRHPNRKVDPQIYTRYYLLLERIYKIYTEYEKQLLSKQLKQQTEHKEHQRIEEREYKHSSENRLIMNENTFLKKTQVIYVYTSYECSTQNISNVSCCTGGSHDVAITYVGTEDGTK